MKTSRARCLVFLLTTALTGVAVTGAEAAVSFCEQPADFPASCGDIPAAVDVKATTDCSLDLQVGNPDPSLVLYYTFDADSGNFAVDQSGYGNNGTLNGTTVKSGLVGSAREFNGASDWIDVPANPSINVGERFTLAVWFKAYAMDTSQMLMFWPYIPTAYSTGGGEAMAMQAGVNVGGYQWNGNPFGANFIDVNGNEVPHVLSSSQPSVGVWHHFAVTYDTDTGIACIYLDGNVVISKYIGHFIPNTKSNLCVGGKPLNYYPPVLWHGLLDEVRVYNRALSCLEVKRLALTIGGSHEIPVQLSEFSSNTCPGTITRVWTATDACGSTAAITQTVTTAWYADSDNDGLLDIYETGTGHFVSQYDTGTRPDVWDTDGDGLNDGGETLGGSDPNNPASVLRLAAPSDFNEDGVGDAAVYDAAQQSAQVQASAKSGGIYLPNIGGVPVTGDFDGDSRADVGVYDHHTGRWIIYRSSVGYKDVNFGFEGTVAVPADYDGDGKADLAVYCPASGMWYINRSSRGFETFQWGYGPDIPVAGDFDGDGRDDAGVFDPTSGMWYIKESGLGVYSTQFGYPGAVPVVGDYDGDGRADLGIFDPKKIKWSILGSSRGFYTRRFGLKYATPVIADFDGDGRSDLAIFRGSTGTWRILSSSRGTTSTFTFGSPYSMPFGAMPSFPH